MLTILGQAIEAAFPVLRLLEPGEPEQFLATTTLAHELENAESSSHSCQRPAQPCLH